MKNEYKDWDCPRCGNNNKVLRFICEKLGCHYQRDSIEIIFVKGSPWKYMFALPVVVLLLPLVAIILSSRCF